MTLAGNHHSHDGLFPQVIFSVPTVQPSLFQRRAISLHPKPRTLPVLHVARDVLKRPVGPMRPFGIGRRRVNKGLNLGVGPSCRQFQCRDRAWRQLAISTQHAFVRLHPVQLVLPLQIGQHQAIIFVADWKNHAHGVHRANTFLANRQMASGRVFALAIIPGSHIPVRSSFLTL